MPEIGTAVAASSSTQFGPSRKNGATYAPMPPSEPPDAQSTQFTLPGASTGLISSDFGRQVPVILMNHQAGSVGLAEANSNLRSSPLTSAMGVSSTNDSPIRSLPVFESHANDLLMTPPSE